MSKMHVFLVASLLSVNFLVGCVGVPVAGDECVTRESSIAYGEGLSPAQADARVKQRCRE